MKGKVKFFNEMKGFGFIIGDDGKEYFVHQTGLTEGVKLNDNDAVEFDVEQGDRGPKAVNVKMDSGEAAPEEAPAEEEQPQEEAQEEQAEETPAEEEQPQEETQEEAAKEAPVEEETPQEEPAEEEKKEE